MKATRIGIFSGSFNPVHIGHLALANYLCEYEGLDEVWFLVTPCNPLKEAARGYSLLPDDVRLDLVRRAIEGYPRFRASDFESRLPRPNYTLHTLDALQRLHPGSCFHLIVGSDNWQLFPRWHQPQLILARHRVIVYPRSGYPVDPATLPPTVRLSSAPVFEISSTFIRRALSEGRDVRYFLHPSVYARLLELRR